MIAKTVFVLVLTILVVNADSVPKNPFLEKLQELLQSKDGETDIGNIILGLSNKEKNPLETNEANDFQETTALILSKFSAALGDYSSKSRGLQSRGLLSITDSTWLNEMVKNVIDFFLVHYEAAVGRLVLYPLRSLADYILDIILPCGIECTVLA